MTGGQALDLEAEKVKPDEAGIIRLQAMKTGALIRFACEAGAIIGRADTKDRERLAEYGSAIGLAFQLADDLLDVTADASDMGKATGKDAAAGKATLVSMHGVEWTKRQLVGLVAQAEEFWRRLVKRQHCLRMRRALSPIGRAKRKRLFRCVRARAPAKAVLDIIGHHLLEFLGDTGAAQCRNLLAVDKYRCRKAFHRFPAMKFRYRPSWILRVH